jgi:hypothetical protein
MTAALLLCTLASPPPEPSPADLPDVRPEDVLRLPPAAVLLARVRFAERHLEWLDARAAALGPSWRDAEYGYREELVRRTALWQAAEAAVAVAEEDPSLCAERLRALRHRLGVVDYNAGRLPELPDPAWLSRID